MVPDGPLTSLSKQELLRMVRNVKGGAGQKRGRRFQGSPLEVPVGDEGTKDVLRFWGTDLEKGVIKPGSKLSHTFPGKILVIGKSREEGGSYRVASFGASNFINDPCMFTIEITKERGFGRTGQGYRRMKHFPKGKIIKKAGEAKNAGERGAIIR